MRMRGRKKEPGRRGDAVGSDWARERRERGEGTGGGVEDEGPL